VSEDIKDLGIPSNGCKIKKRIHILLIEDNLGDVRLIQEFFRNAGHDKFALTIRNSLADGMEALIENEFHVILLDLSLPDSFGLKSVSSMLNYTREIPIVVLTGIDDQSLAIEALKLGAQDYLVKNMINSILLESSIYYAIERHRITQELKLSEKKAFEAFNRAEFFKDLFAHDMSNILQGILSATQLCDIFLTKEADSTDLKQYLGFVKEDIKRGKRLISNVRKISELQKTKIIIKKMDMLSILNRVIISIKKEFSNRIITIKIEAYSDDIKICANSFIEDVFNNILINAVVHNMHSEIEIEIKISKENIEDNEYLRMEFIDNGVGIEDSRKKTIFQRGFKEDKSIYGMGLGLSLVSMIIIEIFKGKIWVEDKISADYSKGSKFVIVIPEVKKE
jgi:signal transduction histidine kinase